MVQPRLERTAERRIFFYRLDAGLDDDGVPIDLDLGPVLRRIQGLPFAPGGRYVTQDADTVRACWIDRLNPNARLRLASIRRSGLPSIEQTGNLRPLLIGPDEGVAEQVHIVIFRETVDGTVMTIAGSEFNSFGPRVSGLAGYLRRHAQPAIDPITFRPLFRRDISEALGRLEDIRLFKIRVAAPYIDVIATENRPLGGAFRAAREVGEADEYEVVMRPRPRSRHTIGQGFLEITRTLAQRDDLRDQVSAFQVRGRDSETEQVVDLDVLSDKLIAKKSILRVGDSRALDSDSAYAAIEQAFAELRDGVLTAASALVIGSDEH